MDQVIPQKDSFLDSPLYHLRVCPRLSIFHVFMRVRTHEGEEGTKLVEFNVDLICCVSIKTWYVSTDKVLTCYTKWNKLIHWSLNLIICCSVVACPFRCIFLCPKKARTSQNEWALFFIIPVSFINSLVSSPRHKESISIMHVPVKHPSGCICILINYCMS